jgi:hypothetical protein
MREECPASLAFLTCQQGISSAVFFRYERRMPGEDRMTDAGNGEPEANGKLKRMDYEPSSRACMSRLSSSSNAWCIRA